MNPIANLQREKSAKFQFVPTRSERLRHWLRVHFVNVLQALGIVAAFVIAQYIQDRYDVTVQMVAKR